AAVRFRCRGEHRRLQAQFPLAQAAEVERFEAHLFEPQFIQQDPARVPRSERRGRRRLRRTGDAPTRTRWAAVRFRCRGEHRRLQAQFPLAQAAEVERFEAHL
ncbi:hypothetical protein CTI14_59425, partial [Methylobacterium radiotolerans]